MATETLDDNAPAFETNRELRQRLAWGVHAFTTSGIIFGFLALVATLKNEPLMAFTWLGVALFVDGIDGTMARKAKVLEYTPNVDGATLDSVIDYFTYVAVPALMIYWFNMMPIPFGFAAETWGIIAAAVILSVSCYTFANVGMKSSDYYFVGFPAIWNVVVLYFFVLDTGWVFNSIVVVLCSILTFIPIKFVHPMRVVKFRIRTILITLLWAAVALSLTVATRHRDQWGLFEKVEIAIWLAATAYFAALSVVRTFIWPNPAGERGLRAN